MAKRFWPKFATALPSHVSLSTLTFRSPCSDDQLASWPIQVLFKKFERPHSVNLMRSDKEFDLAIVRWKMQLAAYRCRTLANSYATVSSGATPSKWPRSTMNGLGAIKAAISA